MSTNKGMQAMQARLAAMTPEERKAASEKALAAKRAKAAARAASTTPTPAPQATAGDPPAPANRHWLVTFAVEHEGQRAAWTCVAYAPGMKRAVRAARQTRRSLGRPGELTLIGVVDRDFAGLPQEQA